MRLLDRYVLRNFLVPFALCVFGFLGIWLVFDLSDNIGEFLETKASPKFIAFFYVTQFPSLIVLCLPIAMLLALLFSLSRMSRTNEIISMLTAGRSVTRLLLPLMVCGLVATAFSMLMNYKLAPHSEALKKVLLNQLHGKEKYARVDGQLFRNRADNRTWYVQKMRVNLDELQNVHIIQQNENGDITRKYYARRAMFLPETKEWRLDRGKLVNFDTAGNITNEELFIEGSRKIEGWSETPWRIASSNLDPQDLSVSELGEYLRFNGDFPDAQLAPYRTHLGYRWALPWSCFVVVFIAAPLGIVYSRRGVLAGVASSIFIFFSMIFLTNFFLALGKGDRIPPTIAAWAPNLVFGAIGALLLHYRATNRELPLLNFKRTKK